MKKLVVLQVLVLAAGALLALAGGASGQEVIRIGCLATVAKEKWL